MEEIWPKSCQEQPFSKVKILLFLVNNYRFKILFGLSYNNLFLFCLMIKERRVVINIIYDLIKIWGQIFCGSCK